MGQEVVNAVVLLSVISLGTILVSRPDWLITNPYGGVEKNVQSKTLMAPVPFVEVSLAGFVVVIQPKAGASMQGMPGPACQDGQPASSMESLRCLLTVHEAWIDSTLYKYGGILLRGFAVTDAREFETAAEALVQPHDVLFEDQYLGTSPRVPKVNNTKAVYTASEIASWEIIPEHLEMSFRKTFPNKIAFWAERPNDGEGGESPLVNFAKVWQDLPDSSRELWASKNLQYARRYFSAARGGRWSVFPLTMDASFSKSWEDMFGVTDAEEAERLATGQGFEVSWPYGRGNLMELVNVMPASRPHTETGEAVWSNHLAVLHYMSRPLNYAATFHRHSSPSWRARLFINTVYVRFSNWIIETFFRGTFGMHVTYGDGTEIPEEEIRTLRGVMWKNTVFEKWQQGDVLFLDNQKVAHGRQPYTGHRRILVTWSERNT